MSEPAGSSSISPDMFDAYNMQLQTAILNPTKLAFSLPADLPFHRSIDRDFAKELDACSSKVLSITNKLLALTATGNPGGKGKARSLDNQEDVVDNFHSMVVDTMDQLLERTDIRLDDFLGRSKTPAIAINLQPNMKQASKLRANVQRGRLDPALQHASHLAKPQLKFKRKPINNRNYVWQPTLKHKYNAQVPLGYNFEYENEIVPSSRISHPYHYEITHPTYLPQMFQSIPPIRPKSFEETPFHWISNISEFQNMLEKLRKAQELAVDLEYHSYRSFNGFVCLMQISTRTDDFIVDTVCLRDELEELNEVFTDPSIVKVFHGAESDIVWLQQDFKVYVVNLFDTFHASKVLEFPRHGLATLLEMYCDFTADKRFQLADWRIRPLPQEMLSYARSDTHFLLYIYDNLRNALFDRAQSRPQSPQPSTSRSGSPSINPAHALVHQVLSRSRETSLRLYQQEAYDVDGGTGSSGWDNLAKKWNKVALMANADALSVGSELTREVYRRVHEWRDRIAREEDESTRYILPNHYLFQLAEQPPADLPGLLNMFTYVPPVIKRKANDLLDEIKDTVRKHFKSRNLQGDTSQSTATPSLTEATERGSEITLAEPPQVDSSLWSNAPLSNIASSSTLFGPSSSDALCKGSYVTSQSSLFGTRLSMPLMNDNADQSKFQEVRLRIHDALVIAPSVPKTNVESPVVGVEEQDTLTSEASVFGEQPEIPFVPAPERRKIEMVDDSIVVVGQQTRQHKKRKRVKAKTISGTVGDEEEEIEEFNYSSAPNMLDANPKDRAEVVSRKKRRGGGGGPQHGGFPAPPKANSQPKSGNQSHTFR